MLNCFKFISPTSIYTPYIHHNGKAKKQGFNLFANGLKIKNVNDSIAKVIIPLSRTVEIKLRSIHIACRCYYISSEVNLWQTQLNGYDLERHTS